MTFIRGPLGFDISFYQDDDQTVQKVDFQKMRNYGGKFVICRAGQNRWVDEDFTDYWKASKQVGLPRAAYYFYDPRVSPEVQAHLFTRLIVDDPPEGRLWVDLEFPKSWGGEFTNWRYWKVFIEQIKEDTGLRIGIYTAAWWWNEVAVSQNADLAYFGQYPLWNAQYTQLQFVTLPRGWSKMMIWQYGTPTIGREVGVESEEVDANLWNNEYSFETEWGGMSVPTPIGGSMKYKVVWSQGVARRTAPTVWGSYTGLSYLFNEVVDVVQNNIPDASEPDNPNKKWVKFADGRYGASSYPNSAGVPQTRMEVVPEPSEPTFPNEIEVTIGSVTRPYVLKV